MLVLFVVAVVVGVGIIKTTEQENYIPTSAIVGRLNVGKSSMLNALVGEDRTIVSLISGTTRDAIETELTGPDERDYKIAESIEREGKGCVTIVNKWDTIPNKKLQTTSYYEEDVKEKFRSLNWAPIVHSTGMVGHSVEKVVATASSVERERSRRWE
ncbi:hypothetical protein IFM89_002764 [Coptis chinensis]|uniref:G domain-containing protein n=1 Tax=Coptis chinensis TaxID=261450 RepID=A0A835LUS4_9MAGN|nr:hypothetical protein IFM89_002764 [Coptis chinensis]